MKTEQEKYAELQELMLDLMDLKVGDTVKILRTTKDCENEMGWQGG